MATQIYLVFTDDWELRGDGSGDPTQIQFRPLQELARIFAERSIRGSFNAEVMQQLTFRSFQDRYPHLKDWADEWERVVTEAFRQGLRDLGYIEGQNIAIEYRCAEGKPDRLPDLAAELIQLKLDLIVTAGNEATQAAKNATGTIPLVTTGSDPVVSGFVANLAHPGGNITGVSIDAPGLSGKRL